MQGSNFSESNWNSRLPVLARSYTAKHIVVSRLRPAGWGPIRHCFGEVCPACWGLPPEESVKPNGRG